MKKLITVLFISMMASIPCLGSAIEDRKKLTEFTEIHKMAMRRFEYGEGNEDGERFHYYSSLSEVEGDCDDFMSAVYFELWKRDLEPEAIAYDFRDPTSNSMFRHTIVCADGYCFDNNLKRPFSEHKLEKRFNSGLYELVARGELNKIVMYDISIFETIVSMATHAA